MVVDIDGVLADAGHREHWLRQSPPDWDAFFAACGDDEPIEAGRESLAAALAEGPVTLLTGRPERLRGATLSWLAEHGYPELPIVMRPNRDRRRAGVFKREALAALGGPGEIALVVDDDPAVVDGLRAAGYLVHLFDGQPWSAAN